MLPRHLPKLHVDGVLFQVVRHQLKLLWSPQPNDSTKSVSHETIYNAVYVHPCGELKRKLIINPVLRLVFETAKFHQLLQRRRLLARFAEYCPAASISMVNSVSASLSFYINGRWQTTDRRLAPKPSAVNHSSEAVHHHAQGEAGVLARRVVADQRAAQHQRV